VEKLLAHFKVQHALGRLDFVAKQVSAVTFFTELEDCFGAAVCPPSTGSQYSCKLLETLRIAWLRLLKISLTGEISLNQ
jgi:hypothetical protein